MRRIGCAVVALLLSTVTGAGCTQSKQTSPLSKEVGCLASQDWALISLHEIGVGIGQKVSIREASGSIPDVTPENPNRKTLLILDHAGRKGWMFFFHESGEEAIVVERNAYRVERSKDGWTASEGNGGLATYRAMSSYAATLYRSPSAVVALKPMTNGCQVE